MAMRLEDEIILALMESDKPMEIRVIRWRVEENRRERELISMSEGFNKFKQHDFPKIEPVATFKRVISTMPDVQVIVINKTYFIQLKPTNTLPKAMITRVYSCLQNYIMKSYRGILGLIELLELPKMLRSLLVRLNGFIKYLKV